MCISDLGVSFETMLSLCLRCFIRIDNLKLRTRSLGISHSWMLIDIYQDLWFLVASSESHLVKRPIMGYNCFLLRWTDVRKILFPLGYRSLAMGLCECNSDLEQELTKTRTPRWAARSAIWSSPSLLNLLICSPRISVPIRGVIFFSCALSVFISGSCGSARLPGSEISCNGTSRVGVKPSGLTGR